VEFERMVAAEDVRDGASPNEGGRVVFLSVSRVRRDSLVRTHRGSNTGDWGVRCSLGRRA
jgi:hypothetical protein